MKKIALFPTWVLVRILPLPKSHLWYKRKFTLTEWSNGTTELTVAFAYNLWLCGISSAIILAYILA